MRPQTDPVMHQTALGFPAFFEQAFRHSHHRYPLVNRELSASIGLVLGGLLETALSRRSPVGPLVSRSPLALPDLVLGTGLALPVWSSAHPPDTCKSRKHKSNLVRWAKSTNYSEKLIFNI